ncbi:POZ domain-containing protein KCTD8 [Seminavis robusta]|uniref:POZ domain-containing protein KCTD8 n=1 Tax=Seminavis robusta TaxID=568900 RepID=A0A9N8H4T4_9STRA|nr:POZ domain-containing protein KCTD8 [Seminavis robusta]|eukprot:Sro93_g048580.1 POZ domain-containing protein KCTD8 (202) ;mRNA; f:80481-81086
MATTETVKLNVGGTQFVVSRSLIEQHSTTMLARLVSDTWQKDPKKEIFIDRDGETFRFVIQFMRDSKVSLPMSKVSKTSLLDELRYFGFQNVDSNAINASCVSRELVDQIRLNNESHETRKTELSLKLCYEVLAHLAYTECCKSGRFGPVAIDHSLPRPKISTWNAEMFNEALAKYGIQGKLEGGSYPYSKVQVRVTRLED